MTKRTRDIAFYTQQTDFDKIDWKRFNFRDLFYWTELERIEEFCINLGLLPKTPGNCACGLPLQPYRNESKYFKKALRCRNRCPQVSYLKNTYFESTSVVPGQILVQLYFSACGLNMKSQMCQTRIGSPTSIVVFENFRRDVAAAILNNDNDIIGGEGVIVEIEASYGYSKKNNICWIIGGVERGSNKCFLRIATRCDANTILSIVQEKVAPKSIIYTKESPVYSSLSKFNYTHHITHNQSVETMWHHFKLKLPKNLQPELKGSYFAKFLYERKFEWHKKGSGEQFKLLCDHISQIFPGPGYTGLPWFVSFEPVDSDH